MLSRLKLFLKLLFIFVGVSLDGHQRPLSNISRDFVIRSSLRHASRNSSIVITPSWLRSSFLKTRSTLREKLKNKFSWQFEWHYLISSFLVIFGNSFSLQSRFTSSLNVHWEIAAKNYHQLMDCLHNLSQLSPANTTVSVQVVQLESPF